MGGNERREGLPASLDVCPLRLGEKWDGMIETNGVKGALFRFGAMEP